jgi:hypothetical protein
MANQEPIIRLAVGKHLFEVNLKTDPDIELIASEVARMGGWNEFKSALRATKREASN